jgi:hypothetical protein
VASTRFLTEATASKRKCGKAADQPSPVQARVASAEVVEIWCP